MNKHLQNHLFGKLGKTLFAWVCILLTVSGTASAQLRSTLFNETIGNVSTTTAIDVHQATGGFDYDGNPLSNPVLNYTGTGDVRNVITSTYSGASGLANIFITSVIGKFFQIGNINTSDPQLTDLRLSFGVYKSNTFSNATELKTEYSTDGILWTALTFTPVATGSTSNVWVYRTSLDSLPHANNLRIRFRQTSINVQFRLDDIKVDYKRICVKPTIATTTSTTFCQGGSVILNGTYLDADSYQWFKDGSAISGANAATYTASTAGAYTVKATVSAISCAKTSDPTTVTVNANPTVSVSAPAAFCQNRSADLVATGNGGTGSLNYTWAPNPQNTDNSNSAIYHVPTSTTGTTTYTVTVNDANNCQGTASTAVTVNAVPAAPSVTAGGNTTFCDGGSVQFTSSAATGNKWYINGTLINPAQTGTTYTADANGSYTVTTTANGCESNASAAQVVNELVVTTPTASITQGANSSVCQNTTVVLTSSASSGNQWLADGVVIAGATATTYIVPTTAVGTVTYTVQQTATTNGVTCNSAASNGIAITVKSIPAAPVASIESGDNPTCEGNEVVLTSNVATGNQWFDGGIAITAETNQTYIAPSATAGTKTFTVTQTVNGCTSAASNSVAVVTNALPAQPTVSTIGSATICDGGNVTLASSTGTTYQWYKNGDLISGATEPTFTIGTAANDNGDYTVVITNSNNCASVPSAAITVVENAVPTVSLTSNPAPVAGTTEICSGNQATFTATANGAGPFTYMFTDGTTTVSSASNTFTASTANTYTVTVKDNNNCTSAVSNALVLVVNSLPTVSITGNGSPTEFEYCAGGSVDLTAVGAGGAGAYSYQWTNGPATASYDNRTTGTTYSVIATDTNGCVSAVAATQTLTENANPTVAFTGNGTPASQQFEYCEDGTGVELTAIGVGGTPGYTFKWADDTTTATHPALLAGTYEVVVTDNKGCKSISTGQTIVENENPTVTISGNGINLGEFEYCASGSIDLTANGNSGHAPYTYQWANGGPATATYADRTEGTPTATIYSVEATDAKGCVSPSASQTITEHANPTVTIAGDGVNLGEFEYCYNGGGVSLTATAAGISGPFVYQWTDGPSTAVYADQLAGSYTVKATDANGCFVTGTAVVIEHALPTVTATAALSSNNDIACDAGAHIYLGMEDSTVVTATATTAFGPVTYAWTGVNMSSTTIQSPIVKPDSSTSYSVTVTDANLCTSLPATVAVVVEDVRGAIAGNVKVCTYNNTSPEGDKQGITTEMPSATVRDYIATAGNASNCLGACDSGIGGLPPDPIGGVVPPIPPVPNPNDPPVTVPPVPPVPPVPDPIEVIGGLLGGKAATPVYANSVNAYPNPFSESINLAITLAEESPVNIIISDMLGRVVVNMNQGTMQAGEYVIPVDGTNMAEGMYACTVKTANTIKVINIVRTTIK